MTKLLLVDDHDLVRTGIRRLLDDISDIEVVGEATCGEDAIKFAGQHELDVILMDINMPGMGGLEATRKLQTINPELKIIIVTMHEDDLFAQRSAHDIKLFATIDDSTREDTASDVTEYAMFSISESTDDGLHYVNCTASQ